MSAKDLAKERSALLRNLLSRKILVLDGAMGTAIQSRGLGPSDFGGPEFEGCNENLVLTRPDVVSSIHEGYLTAGCDIIETNTFGATPLVLSEYGLSTQTEEINHQAAALARRVAERHSTPEQPRFVAGSIGPTTKAISVTGGVTFEELVTNFHLQARALMLGGTDYLLLETCQDTRNIKAGILGVHKAFDDLDYSVPIAVSGTIEAAGTMLAGQTVESLMASLSHLDLLYLGLNCATGPEFMTDHVRSLAGLSRFPIACVPNAGLPDQNGNYLETPEMVAGVLRRFLARGWVNLIGGCCGTHTGHIAALSKLRDGISPSLRRPKTRSFLSGIDYLEVTDDIRPVIVGERTNVIGSRKFKTLITEEKFEEAAEIARSQIKNGAQVIDVCVANPDRDELVDMRSFMEVAAKKVRAPFMIDSTDSRVIQLALSYCQGKAIINSINLEDGETRFEQITPLARRFGAALVVGCIDEDPAQGMGVTRARKLSIAERSFHLLTEKYGIPPEDIYFDPLVFPCATGDAQYIGSAVETIEGLRTIKTRFPQSKTILGISNVSFGLPQAGREILNTVFLYHCVQAGLDLAIVNAEKLERYATLAEEDRLLAENLIFNRGADPAGAFATHFRERKAATNVQERDSLPLDARLSRYIVEGSKDGLQADLALALQTLKPLEIINGPLMRGMDEVGRLFNANQLIVAEVLQSAEVMKAAVSHLEPHLEKASAATRGKVLLATVKGDVHDIGKSLVEIILSNNGFEVINLGIRVPPEKLIQAVREHRPDLIGLSGLLVKSAHQMTATAEDFEKAGIHTPVLVGGAALSPQFVDQQIAQAYTGTVAYAKDAMAGLDLAKTIVDPVRFEDLKRQLSSRRAQQTTAASTKPGLHKPPVTTTERAKDIAVLSGLPTAPDFERHILRSTPIEQIWNFINPLMLYGRHLGIPGALVRELQKAATDPAAKQELFAKQPKALAIWDAVEEVKHDYGGTEVLQPSAIYRFMRAASDGNRLLLFSNAGESRPEAVFDFPRQRSPQGLCLSDYVAPVHGPEQDSIALFIVSVGRGIRQLAENLKARGDYLKSHIIQALALESAEAYAEWIHVLIRRNWGFPDPPELTLLERFQARYRGKRYSFGYPACPKLDDQQTLFQLLTPSEISVQLTDGMMMDPEASVSALVFHHPQASYFSAGSRGGADDDQR